MKHVCLFPSKQKQPYNQLDDDTQDEDQITELCETLYYQSAKCNKALGDVYTVSLPYIYSFQRRLHCWNKRQNISSKHLLFAILQNQNEANTENMVCYYIANIVENKYDEYGEIYLNNFDFRKYVTTMIEETSEAQILALGSMIFICVGLLMYACFLHRSLTHAGDSPEDEWVPRKGLYYGDISRQNSGIVMGRSRSGGSFDGGIMA